MLHRLHHTRVQPLDTPTPTQQRPHTTHMRRSRKAAPRPPLPGNTTRAQSHEPKSRHVYRLHVEESQQVSHPQDRSKLSRKEKAGTICGGSWTKEPRQNQIAGMWRWDKGKGKEERSGLRGGEGPIICLLCSFSLHRRRRPSTVDRFTLAFQGSVSRVGVGSHDDRHTPKIRPRVDAHLPNRNCHCKAERAATRAA